MNDHNKKADKGDFRMKKTVIVERLFEITSLILQENSRRIAGKYVFKGRLVIDREQGSEWGYLLVDGRIRSKCFEMLGLKNLGFVLPDYEPHISAFCREEVQGLEDHLPQEGMECEFTLKHLKVVNPEDWDEVNSCVILCVECGPLERLRKHLGLTPLMYGKHEFHITIGVAEKEIDPSVENLVRMFNEYLKRDLGLLLYPLH